MKMFYAPCMKAHRAKDRLGLTLGNVFGPNRLVTDYASTVCVRSFPKPQHRRPNFFFAFEIPCLLYPPIYISQLYILQLQLPFQYGVCNMKK